MSKCEEIKVMDWRKAFVYLVVGGILSILLFLVIREVLFILMVTNRLSIYLDRMVLNWYDYQTIKMSIYGVLIGCYSIAITVLFTVGGLSYFGYKWLDKNIDEN